MTGGVPIGGKSGSDAMGADVKTLPNLRGAEVITVTGATGAEVVGFALAVGARVGEALGFVVGEREQEEIRACSSRRWSYGARGT